MSTSWNFITETGKSNDNGRQPKNTRGKRSNPNNTQRPNKRHKKNDTEIMIIPYSPVESITAANSIFSQTDMELLSQVELEDDTATDGIINFTRIDDNLIHIHNAPPDSTHQPNIQNDIDVLQFFNKLFEPFFNILLTEMNEMRQLRSNARRNHSTGSRIGRPANKEQPTTYDRIHYDNSFLVPFTRDNLNCFLACFFQMCTLQGHNMSIYWRNGNADQCGHASWFGVRMSQYLFNEMFRCINPNIDCWVKTVNEQCHKNKVPTREISFDESMDPTKNHNNPHHVFIKRKPHPHGTKLESAADADTYYIAFNLHKRTVHELSRPILANSKCESLNREQLGLVTPKTIPEIVSILAQHLNPGHLIVADKWFGNLDVAETLQEQGHDCILKCMNNRPTLLWKLAKELEINDLGYKCGTFLNNNHKPMYCYCKPKDTTLEETDDDSGSYENLLTTIESNNYYHTTIDTINNENERVKKQVVLNDAYLTYNRVSGYVDQANQAIMSCYWHHRVYNYQTSLVIFFLLVLAHNARVLFNLASGKLLSQGEYLEKLAQQLYVVNQHIETHELKKLKDKKRINCHCCYWLGKCQGLEPSKIKRSKSAYGCTNCRVAMCKRCFNSMNHQWFAVGKYFKQS